MAAADLHGGGVAGQPHALAAVYLGFSIAFGPSLVRWADVRFAHRFAGGPPPRVVPKRGPERVRYEWREWGKAVLGAVIAVALLRGGRLWVGDEHRTAALQGGRRWVGDEHRTAALQGGRLWVGDEHRTAALQGMTQLVGFVIGVWLLGRPVWVAVVQLLTAHTIGRKQSTSKTKRR